MANTVFMSKTGLIGGEATKLDSIDGAVLVDGDAAFVNVLNVQYIYRLDADSGAAESSPNIIAPATNPGDKRWILQGLNGASLNMPGLSASLPVFTDGSKNLVSNTITGTGSVVMSASPTFSASATLSGLTASLPVFTNASKALVSKSVADALTALGVSTYVDYSATSTIVGWSSFTTKILRYKCIDQICFVEYNFAGIGNSTTVTFTLPEELLATISHTIRGLGSCLSGGSVIILGGKIAMSGQTVSLYTDTGDTGWAGSGMMNAYGSFWYSIAGILA